MKAKIQIEVETSALIGNAADRWATAKGMVVRGLSNLHRKFEELNRNAKLTCGQSLVGLEIPGVGGWKVCLGYRNPDSFHGLQAYAVSASGQRVPHDHNWSVSLSDARSLGDALPAVEELLPVIFNSKLEE